MTFIDLEKAYDSVPRQLLWTAMRNMNIHHKWINIVRKMYSNTKAKIKIQNKLTEEIRLNKGLKQGCSLSPVLFNIYIDQALNLWYKKCSEMGIPIEDKTLHSLLFADDQVIFAGDEDDMIYMVNKLMEEYRKWGLNINLQKTEYMCLGKDVGDLILETGKIKKCESFKYLGSIITNIGTCERDIQNKIALAKNATKTLHGIIWNKNITKETKIKIYKSIIQNILSYGSETWSMTELQKNKIRTVEFDYLRRSLQKTRQDKIRNELLWKEMNVTTSVVKRIENQTLKWYGHVQRMGNERWPKNIYQWSPPGKNKRGRPKLKWKTHVRAIMDDRNLEEGDWNDRYIWKLKTANL